MSDIIDYNRHLVVLAHGVLNNDTDMNFLEQGLKKEGYSTFSVTLPLTFGSMKDAYKAIKHQVGEILGNYDVVHFVGYSMGGLVIQKFLSMNKLDNLGNCVFIATPHKGSKLANLASSVPFVSKIFKPLLDLKTDRVVDNIFKHHKGLKVGIIAGSKNDNFYSRLFLSHRSDGLVEIQSAKHDEMHDYAHFPYIHKEIHVQKDVLVAVCKFMADGTFK